MTDGQKCSRCYEDEASIAVRQGQLCEGCFLEYIRHKAWRGIDVVRQQLAIPRGSSGKVMLACSGGPSSLALLELLSLLIKRQQETNRAVYYRVVVVHVYEGQPDWPADELRGMFPEMEFCAVPLQDAFACKSFLLSPSGTVDASDGIASVALLRERVPNRTSRADLVRILRGKLLLSIAKQKSCRAIWLGDSLSRVAQTILSYTAQGRGRSIPLELHGDKQEGVLIVRPMKEVLDTEIKSYNAIRGLSSLERDERLPQNTRDMTIDQLMKQYLHEIHDKFPAVASTIAATSSKLRNPDVRGEVDCIVCGIPCSGRDAEWFDKMTVLHTADEETGTAEEGRFIPLCYGCFVSTRGIAQPIPWVRPTTAEDLSEYLIPQDGPI